MPFLIEAFVQDAENYPYVKISFLSESNDIDKHLADLTGRMGFHRVLSVKSTPALDVDIVEYAHDLQGNNPYVDCVPLEVDETVYAGPTDSNT